MQPENNSPVLDPAQHATTKPRKHQKPQLRVVFDTNVLYTDSESYLVRQEAAKLIEQSKFPDLEIQWYLPEVVRHERQYQMQKRALKLLSGIEKVERLLGHNLNITEKILIDRVEKAVCQRQEELGLISLQLDYSKVEWHRVALDAAYRRPPFEDGETEKGFRDSLIVECFLQLVADSPKTAKACRLVLVTGDELVTQAVKTRTADSTNTAVISTLEELKELINTLVSEVDEEFLAVLKPKAKKLFFIEKDESTLYYKEHIRDKLGEKFATELTALPPGATHRKNGKWLISPPNFVKKTGQRIQWTTRIEIVAEASKTVPQAHSIESPSLQVTPEGMTLAALNPKGELGGSAIWPYFLEGGVKTVTLRSVVRGLPSFSSVTTHRGVDVYEVIWSVSVTTTRELRKPSIEDIIHAEPTWEQVT